MATLLPHYWWTTKDSEKECWHFLGRLLSRAANSFYLGPVNGASVGKMADGIQLGYYKGTISHIYYEVHNYLMLHVGLYFILPYINVIHVRLD